MTSETLRLKRSFLIVFSLSLFAFVSGGVFSLVFSQGGERDFRSLQFFTRVYDLVKKQYVEEPQDDKLVEGAIRGMVSSLDAHSEFMTAEEFAELQSDTKGQFGGLGIEIIKRNGLLTIVSPIEDTPAYREGLKSGDIIVTIEGKPTDKMSTFDAIKLMRGEPGNAVRLGLRRQGVQQLIEKKITRAIIRIKSVTFKEQDGFGVIRIRQFAEKTAEDFRKALKELSSKKPIKGLVLDLRNNPGGLLQQAVEIADAFIEGGLIVYTQGRDKSQMDKKLAVARGTEPNYPVVVLINGGSASASEIVAGALQDQEPKRGHVMGTQSFGKGSVQSVIPLDDGSGLKLTVALYYTPKGRTIQGVGITPDEIVEPLEEVGPSIREKDLPGHIVGQDEKLEEEKNIKTAKKKVDLKKLTALEKEDFQLAKAVAYLKSKVKK